MEQGEDAAAVASANEGMVGAALDLAKEVGIFDGVAGQALSSVAGQALSSVLSVAAEFPFLSPIVEVLNQFKVMVETYKASEEECKRLVVWCTGLLGCITKLYSGGGGEANPSVDSLGLLTVAVTALQELKDMVKERMERSDDGFTWKGVFQSVAKFWTAELFLRQCEDAKKKVKSALKCLMIDVSVDTKKGVDELLRRTDHLIDMKQSMEQLRGLVVHVEGGVAHLVKESNRPDRFFIELLFQVDPALMGQAKQSEQMFSLASTFEKEYTDQKRFISRGAGTWKI